MTAPTLPDTLERLAELIPLRVRIDPHREASYAEVRVRGEWQYVYYITPDSPAWASHGLGEMWLEAAIREECEARGWDWAVYRCGPTVRAVIYEVPGRDSSNVIDLDGEAATPAHALALALLAALAGGAV